MTKGTRTTKGTINAKDCTWYNVTLKGRIGRRYTRKLFAHSEIDVLEFLVYDLVDMDKINDYDYVLYINGKAVTNSQAVQAMDNLEAYNGYTQKEMQFIALGIFAVVLGI